MWVCTVANIDWPSRRDLTVPQQKREFIRIIELARAMNMNAIILQVRPAADAIYQSTLEPWSEFLTGQQGKAPVPFYDPLQFAVEECHQRGLELHAWVNPYRGNHLSMKAPLAPNHISKTQPDLVKPFGKYLWLDPGEKGVQDHTVNVINDIVRRYDVDGIHFDDYFYPYPSYSPGTDFPDTVSWNKYQATGGKLNRADWRRENVNVLVKAVSENIHKIKPHVKFGIAPFGIWQPGNPPGISGMNAYETLYKDSRKWIQEGWVDYLSPQLYWKIDAPKQSYPVLLKWWAEQNPKGHHMWPGLYVSGVNEKTWLPTETINQVQLTRKQQGSTGNIFFSVKPLLKDQAGIVSALKTQVYTSKALVPASPWLDAQPPAAPQVTSRAMPNQRGQTRVRWQATGSEAPWLYTIYAKVGASWHFDVVPGTQSGVNFASSGPAAPVAVAVAAVDKAGNESEKTLINPRGDVSQLSGITNP